MNNVYIKHSGVKGMKWGVRRSASQLGNDSGGSSSPKSPKTADDYKRMKKTTDTTKGYVDMAKKKTREVEEKKAKDKIKTDIENMSDKDLQKIVNRLNMEERYTQVMNSRATTQGKSRTERILENTGTALAVGSSVLSIMIAMKELQK